jgi:hypothetical protein
MMKNELISRPKYYSAFVKKKTKLKINQLNEMEEKKKNMKNYLLILTFETFILI